MIRVSLPKPKVLLEEDYTVELVHFDRIEYIDGEGNPRVLRYDPKNGWRGYASDRLFMGTTGPGTLSDNDENELTKCFEEYVWGPFGDFRGLIAVQLNPKKSSPVAFVVDQGGEQMGQHPSINYDYVGFKFENGNVLITYPKNPEERTLKRHLASV